MKVLNFGSLNIDWVYKVSSIVKPGETISSYSTQRYPGGKGLNQSIALARAGVPVFHAGAIGEDGLFLRQLLEQEGADCSLLKIREDISTGMAFIQVADSGENSIVLSGGANQTVEKNYIHEVFDGFGSGDILIIQNEISNIGEIIRCGAQCGMKIFFNPAPMSPETAELPLDMVDTLIVNDTEYETLKQLGAVIPSGCNLLFTHGAKGASYLNGGSGERFCIPAADVEQVVDTTAAGDTFIGYFIAGIMNKKTVVQSMEYAAKAAAICVSRPGAAPSIPFANEIV